MDGSGPRRGRIVNTGGADLILLRWRWRALRAGVQGLRRSSTWFELVVVGGGSGLLAVYFLAGIGEWLGRVAGMVAGFDFGRAAMAGSAVVLGLLRPRVRSGPSGGGPGRPG